ncbi:MAG TPA: 16S rRNA (adenine(1518)-N(6)/adenine(1519)-N(6))-dimethyltransferase RsmA [Anaerolineae bacterium]|nr:16S rRNA (adenine(1518)-N(6)/adenine(1519)-N(6))-dimethyltransferase RsmA [Anaerolineae bacterium]HQK13289.1 16S rRNA (adenine(1518)-N(6)/adenine(1519)-N(6))-dimethyltransferase RsmA [Anaerolineae bacterium]
MTNDPRALLRHYGLAPRKSLGQNFLVDPAAPARIAALAELTPADTVIEVGAGLGTLTAALAARAGRVIAVETDPHLVAILHQELAAFDNVTIVHGDILDLDPAALLNVPPAPLMPLWGTRLPHYHVVANLPYYITAAVLRHLLEATVRPAGMVVTVQREVAERMIAVPDEMSVLAVSVQFYGKPRIGLRLKRGAFFPPPDVESAVVRLDLYATPPIPVTDVAHFFRVVRAGFAQRRKQLRNTLAATLALPVTDVVAALERVGVDATRRAETLTLEEWGQVAGALSCNMEA